MPWVLRACGALAEETVRAAQMDSAGSSLFCFWLRTPSLEAHYPELLGQPAGSLTFRPWQVNPRCVSDGKGEAKSRALKTNLYC